MDLLELSLPTAAENVALDEALLDEAESGSRVREMLRLWELPRLAVVIGRSSRIREELRWEECRRRGIEVVRRSSGGAAIAAGPGCLMYSMLLSYRLRPELRWLDRAHEFVLRRLSEALGQQVAGVQHSGTSDLALGGRKFSGNSLHCKRDWLIYHGTLLYAFDLVSVAALLAAPPRQPEYRQGRDHSEFLTNLPLSRSALEQLVAAAFDAVRIEARWPREEVQRLVQERYGRDEWTQQR